MVIQAQLPTIADVDASLYYQRLALYSDDGHERIEKVLKERYGSGQCVALPQALGFDIHAGAARNWPTAAANAGYTVDMTPEEGSVIVTGKSGTGHVVLQTGEMDARGWIPVKEQNLISRTVTEGFLHISDPHIIAFIHRPPH